MQKAIGRYDGGSRSFLSKGRHFLVTMSSFTPSQSYLLHGKGVTAQRQLARSTVESSSNRNFDVYSPASGKLKHAQKVVSLQAHSHE